MSFSKTAKNHPKSLENIVFVYWTTTDASICPPGFVLIPGRANNCVRNSSPCKSDVLVFFYGLWTDITTDGHNDGRKYGRIYGRTNGQIYGRTDERTDGHTDGQTFLKRCEDASKNLMRSADLFLHRNSNHTWWTYQPTYRRTERLLFGSFFIFYQRRCVR